MDVPSLLLDRRSEGHVWALATIKETLNEGDVQRRAEEFMAAMSKKK
jgi:hypothetical protein